MRLTDNAVGRKDLGKARVAAARKLGIRLWIMLRDQIDYQEFCRRGQMQQRSGDACAGMPGARHRLIIRRPVSPPGVRRTHHGRS
jgi:hypothetical protein